MCGICGVAVPSQLRIRVNESRLVAMRDSLTHRGPGDAGILIDGSGGLGHRRLSIVDLGGGRQPMANQNGCVWSPLTGRSCSPSQLRPRPRPRGPRHRSSSDAETIICLYEEFGPRGVERLRGMFAYAIWDGRRRRLVIARDRLGIKPLYYAIKDDGSLYFASEIKALVEAGAIRP